MIAYTRDRIRVVLIRALGTSWQSDSLLALILLFLRIHQGHVSPWLRLFVCNIAWHFPNCNGWTDNWPLATTDTFYEDIPALIRRHAVSTLRPQLPLITQTPERSRSQEDAALLPLAYFDKESFLLDEPVIVHGPLSVLLGHFDIETQHQLRNELVHFHEGDVFAEACTSAAAKLFRSTCVSIIRPCRMLSLF